MIYKIYDLDKIKNQINNDVETVSIGMEEDWFWTGTTVYEKNKFVKEVEEQLKDKTLSRIYIALVHGKINHDTGTIDAPIGRDISDRKKMCVTDDNSKEAITHFKVLERFKNASLIICS